MTRLTRMRGLFAGAVLVGFALRLFFVQEFPYIAPDTKLYDELARNWLDHGVYGLFLNGQLLPVDIRAPGYPAFLAAVYGVLGRAPQAVMWVQAAVDLATCLLTAALAARLAPSSTRARVAAAALWLAALCPFLANYSTALLTETLATFLTTVALLLLVAAYEASVSGSGEGDGQGTGSWLWFLGSLVVGLGTLVRPETPLVLVAVALVLVVRWRRPVDWAKLIRVGLLLACGLLLPLLPWAARNWHTLGRVQFLAPRYTELPGEDVPRGFYAWTKTWLVRFRDVYLVPWKLGEEPIRMEDLPASAFDSPEERARVEALLEQYNDQLALTPALDGGFAQLARERSGRHPLRTHLWIPAARVGTLWFTPRIELLPYSGHVWPLAEAWEEDRTDLLVTLGFTLLNVIYVGLAMAGAWRGRCYPAVALLVATLLVRTAFLTQMETPEPRYVLTCFPAILALAAQIWQPKRAVPEARRGASGLGVTEGSGCATKTQHH